MLDHVVVLGVDQEHGVQALDLLHQVVEMPGAHHPGLAGAGGGPDVGGENLYGGETVFHRLMKGTDDFLRYGPQHHQVVGVVGVGVAPPDCGALLHRLGYVDPRVLDGEVQQSCGAAEQGGPAHLFRRGGLEVAVPHNRRGDMSVGLDAARDHYLARGVDNTSRLIAQGAGGGNRRDRFSLDGNVPLTYAHGCDDLSATDD